MSIRIIILQIFITYLFAFTCKNELVTVYKVDYEDGNVVDSFLFQKLYFNGSILFKDIGYNRNAEIEYEEEYFYNSNGKLSETKRRENSNIFLTKYFWNDTSISEIRHSKNGRLFHIKKFSSNIDPFRKIVLQFEVNNNNQSLISQDDTYYDSLGRKILEYSINSKGDTTLNTMYLYYNDKYIVKSLDIFGKCIDCYEVFFDKDLRDSIKNNFDKDGSLTYNRQYFYNQKGNLLKLLLKNKFGDIIETEEYVYNSNFKLQMHKKYNFRNKEAVFVYHDELGKKILEEYYSENLLVTRLYYN